jgi:hypothetical protein
LPTQYPFQNLTGRVVLDFVDQLHALGYFEFGKPAVAMIENSLGVESAVGSYYHYHRQRRFAPVITGLRDRRSRQL